MQITPYLTFNGNCREAIEFYAKLLGGEITMMSRFSEAPAGEHGSPDWGDKIMHVRLVLDDQVLMASDAPPQYRKEMAGFAVSLGVDSVAEAERIFAGLAEGGQATMPIQETFWAARFGMVTDRFGTPWMVNCHQPG